MRERWRERSRYRRADIEERVLVEAGSRKPEALIFFLFKLLVIAVQAADLNVLHCFARTSFDRIVVAIAPAEELQGRAQARVAAKQQLNLLQRLASGFRQQPAKQDETHQSVAGVQHENTWN